MIPGRAEEEVKLLLRRLRGTVYCLGVDDIGPIVYEADQTYVFPSELGIVQAWPVSPTW